MASGRPVVAYRGGGALETIIEGETGVFFDQQTEIDLAQAVGRFQTTRWDPQRIRQHALKFDIGNFRRSIYQLLNHRRVDEQDGRGDILGIGERET